MLKKLGLLALFGTLFCTNANALEFRPYVGLQYNYSEIDAEDVTPDMNSYSVILGTEYNRYFGTEIFYQNSDKSNDYYKGEKVKTDFAAYGLDAYGYLPLGCDRVFSLLATAGIANYDFDITTPEEKGDDNGLGYRLGAGIQYSLTNNISFRAIGRYIWLDKVDGADNAQEYSLGVKYTF